MKRRQHPSDLRRAIQGLVEQIAGIELAEADFETRFVELGFDSLLVTQIAQRVSQRFGVPLKLRRLLDDLSSVNALAVHLETLLPNAALEAARSPANVEEAAAEVPAASRPADMRDILARQVTIMRRQLELLAPEHAVRPANATSDGAPIESPANVVPTDAQTEIWAAIQLGGELANVAYNESISLVMRGALDEGALSRALSRLAARHEALRSTFAPDGHSVRFAAPDAFVLAFVCEDLRGGSSSDAAAEARRREATTPFDLERGPLVRFRLLRTAELEHELLLTVHHLACDGSSLDVLASELGALYTQEATGATVELPAPAKFSDYARRDAAAARSAEAADAAAFFRELHRETPAVFDVPADHPRPAERTFACDREQRTLAAPLVRKLRALGSEASGASLAATLLAGFEVLLFRISGERRFAIAMPFAGQVAAGEACLVGHCVHTLPLRADVDPDASFKDHLQGVRAHLLDAMDHGRFTVGALLREIVVPRDPSRIPFAPVLFNVERTTARLEYARMSVTCVTNPHAFQHFELFLSALEANGEVVLSLTYNTSLFDRATVKRRLAELERLLDAAVQAPLTAVGKLPILEANEAQVIQTLARTAGTSPAHRSVVSMIEEQALRTPSAIAVESASERLTYEELDERSNRLAQYLVALGVRDGNRVGIAVDRGVELPVALLGVLKASATYVPLDPEYPPARLDFMARDARLSAIVTEQRFADLLPAFEARRILVDTDRGRIAAEPSNRPPRRDDPDRVAYVLHTSGSTGKPKGVLVPHGAVVNFLSSMATEPGLRETDVLGAVTTLSFDIAVLELFLPLTVGARVVVLSRDVAADGRRLSAAIRHFGVTAMQATPATFRLLVDAGFFTPSVSVAGAGESVHEGARLKLLVGGEALPRDLARSLLEGGAAVWNMYGPTETTVWSTCHRVRSADGPIPIGRPIARTSVHVLDERGQPVPLGIPGELFIGGAGVARGYLDRPELTLERFVESPFEQGSTLYRTGDLVRVDSSGVLHFERRVDRQVKVRGHRIELEEIESVLSADPRVRECVVLVRQDEGAAATDVRIVAYVGTGGAAVSPKDLRARIGDSLPAYMTPHHFVTMDALPRTPNGKVDARALPAPSAGRGQSGSAFASAATDTERFLCALWSELLEIERVGGTDDFFELGGHSLLATRMLARVTEQFEVEVGLRELFKSKTIRALAGHIDELRLRTAEVAGPVSSSGFEEVVL